MNQASIPGTEKQHSSPPQHPGRFLGHIKLYSSWNVMAHGDAREGKWRGNWQMELVASTFHTTSEHGVSIITTADAHTSAASSRLNWRPRRFKWTRPFRRKTKFGFCACDTTFQLAYTYTTGTVGFFPGVQADRARIWQLKSLEHKGLQCVEPYLHSQIVLMTWCLIKDSEKFALDEIPKRYVIRHTGWAKSSSVPPQKDVCIVPPYTNTT